MPHIGKVVAGVMLLFLAACASQIKTDVARFHRMPAPQGESFRVVAMDPKKQDSLEFATYAEYVAAEMVKQGYTRAQDAGSATLEVRVDYAVSPGQEKIATRPGTSIAPYYYSWHRRVFYPWGWGAYDPFWGGPFTEPEIYSYTVYTRSMTMDIVRPGAEGGNTVPLFEGRVVSVGKDNRLPEVMPYLVQAMFTDFPGTSGVTKQVKIDLPSK
ncbi:DUF4136 domain-containing protein [Pedomonas sp. V897]|uniref:DUF4136 domain-containing protein n=1 Tax=Pedomonas sp. V897 TaxID=3446482 RepID=UPI003EE31ED7